MSQEENLTYEEVESLFIMLSQSADDKEWANRKRLSIDEISKRKGHKNFITLVTSILDFRFWILDCPLLEKRGKLILDFGLMIL